MKNKITLVFKCIAVFLTVIALNTKNVSSQDGDTTHFEQLFDMSLEELMDIEVVTASKHSQKITDAPATVLVITSQQIAERGYYDLDDALRDLPGIDMIRTYGVFPVVRTFRGNYGDENRRILLMVDGMVENQLMGSFEMGGASYSLHNVERLEVIWGPASALYGANAYSGIINIITKKGDKYSGFEYQRGFGSFNTEINNFSFNGNKENLSVALSGSLVNSDGPKFQNRHPKFSDAYIDNAYTLWGRFQYESTKGKTTLGINLFRNPTGDGTFGQSITALQNLPTSGNMNQGLGGYISHNFNNDKASRWEAYTSTIYVKHDYEINNNLSLSGKFFYRETGIDEDSYSFLQVSDTSIRKNTIAHHSNRIGGELQADIKISENSSLITGIQYNQDNLERGYRGWLFDPTYKLIDSIWVLNLGGRFKDRKYTIQHNIGTYAQFSTNTNLFNSTSFTLGARYDKNNIYGGTFNPRAGIVISPNDILAIKMLYGTAFRAPTNFELYSEAAGVRIPNPDLEPERISTYELGLSFKFKYMFIQISSFYNSLTDLIVADIPIGNGVGQVQNKGKAKVIGFEVSSNFQLQKNINGFANFSYQDAEQTIIEETTKMPNIADMKANMGFTFRISNLMVINLTENWIGERSVPASNPLDKVDSYFSTNLSFSTTEFFKNKVRISLTFRNLFDEKYYDPGIRAANGGKSIYSTVHEQPGRYGLLKLIIKL